MVTDQSQGRSQDFSKGMGGGGGGGGKAHCVKQRVLTRLWHIRHLKKAYKGGVTGTPEPP